MFQHVAVRVGTQIHGGSLDGMSTLQICNVHTVEGNSNVLTGGLRADSNAKHSIKVQTVHRLVNFAHANRGVSIIAGDLNMEFNELSAAITTATVTGGHWQIAGQNRNFVLAKDVQLRMADPGGWATYSDPHHPLGTLLMAVRGAPAPTLPASNAPSKATLASARASVACVCAMALPDISVRLVPGLAAEPPQSPDACGNSNSHQQPQLAQPPGLSEPDPEPLSEPAPPQSTNACGCHQQPQLAQVSEPAPATAVQQPPQWSHGFCSSSDSDSGVSRGCSPAPATAALEPPLLSVGSGSSKIDGSCSSSESCYRDSGPPAVVWAAAAQQPPQRTHGFSSSASDSSYSDSDDIVTRDTPPDRPASGTGDAPSDGAGDAPSDRPAERLPAASWYEVADGIRALRTAEEYQARPP
jgi:hypothetical protein